MYHQVETKRSKQMDILLQAIAAGLLATLVSLVWIHFNQEEK